jgi:nucleoside-diphosphate-sugar epimerase
VRKPDISRARAALGWNPKVELKEGIGKTIPYFQEKLKGEK